MVCEVGISFHTAPVDLRDRVAFSAETAAAFRQRLAAAGIVQSMTLSTCNRCEVFFATGKMPVVPVARLFQEAFPDVDLSAALETRLGTEAIAYLFRIAAGMESMVFGEYQILGQVKEAYASARESGHVGKELDRILRDAISCAKRVKTELDIGAVPPSVCRAGMELVDRSCGIAGRRVFVIGSGRTGTLAAKLAKRCGAAFLAVCNRSPERTRRLVEEVGAVAVDYAARYETIAASDIVISATASPHVVVEAAKVPIVRPVTFLDLASPRDVEPALGENPLVTLISIDTIGELAAGNRAERERLVERGMRIIDAAVAETTAWLEAVR